MKSQIKRSDRIMGCLIGGMLGDAIGSQFEGSALVGELSIPEALRSTDDTQLTIATCESIVQSKNIDPELIAANFVRWFRERRITGIGASTLKAMIELDAGGHWAMVGASGERAAGNGAAMRIAPLAFFVDPRNTQDKRKVRDVCRITHRSDEAYLGALAIVIGIHQAMNGAIGGSDLIESIIGLLPDSRVRDRMIFVRDVASTIESYGWNFDSTGYVVDSVPLAILAAVRARSFMDSIERLVSLGGDTDTVCSMFGQLFGAAHGLESLPSELIEQVDYSSLVLDIAKKLGDINVV